MGTVYTKSVYTVPVTSKRSRKSTMDLIVTGTVYTKSVYTVPVTVTEAEIQQLIIL